MRNLRTEAIIVKRHNIGEADRLITVFTPYLGKMTVKATGVRKITSRRSAHIELLNNSMLSLYKGAGMHVLTEAKMLNDFEPVKRDFTKVGIAYHLCELVDGLCPENQEHPNVYYLLKKTLHNLAVKEFQPHLADSYTEIIDDYTLGTFGLDEPVITEQLSELDSISALLHTFELALLSELGYWDKSDKTSQSFDSQAMIESIMERKLRSRRVFAKIQ